MAVTVRCVRGVEYIGDPEPLAARPVVFRVERQRGMGGWVAQITAMDPKAPGGLRRQFVDGCRSNLSRAGNGVVVFEVGRPGVYEVEFIYRSLRPARLYCIVHPDGRVEEIDWAERDPLSRQRRPRKVDEAIAAALGQLSATA
jgi:hypothetical protein